ncbi:hypothetical protein SAVIM338S_00919 [Streptomyces avidinii]
MPDPSPHPVTRQDVFAVVRSRILVTLPHLDEANISLSANLRDLGADSLDRIDIVTAAQAELGICLNAEEFTGVANLAGLVEALYAHGRRP